MDDSEKLALVGLLRLIHDFKNLLAAAAQVAETEATRTVVRKSDYRTTSRLRDVLTELFEECRVLYKACSDILNTVRIPADNEENARPGEATGSSPIEVLWIDDDALHLSNFRGPFEDAKWVLTAATTVSEALALVSSRTFDGVLVDLIMPAGPLSVEETFGGRLTGLALSRRIRSLHPRMPIAFLTVAKSEEVAEWCRENPPATMLFKPQLGADTVRRLEALIRYRTDSALDGIESVLERFPRFVRALAQRHDGRPSLDVADEYDIQDLLRAMLTLNYDSVLAEEWTPSYAGGSSRIDFLFPTDRVAIEVKMTRPNLALKHLGDQLLIDIARYRNHPKVRALICFVVDVGGIVTNSGDFIKDLISRSSLNWKLGSVCARSDC